VVYFWKGRSMNLNDIISDAEGTCARLESELNRCIAPALRQVEHAHHEAEATRARLECELNRFIAPMLQHARQELDCLCRSALSAAQAQGTRPELVPMHVLDNLSEDWQVERRIGFPSNPDDRSTD